MRYLFILGTVAHVVRTYEGKMVALFNDYTYVKTYDMKRKTGGSRWSCTTTKPEKCLAKIVLRENGTVRKVFRQHQHPPPRYHVNQHGVYFKL